MQASIESIGTLGRKLTISLPKERVTSQVKARLQEVARTARINGFRRGKIPPQIIVQRYGEQVHNDIVSQMVQETFASTIQEKSIRIAGYPQIAPSSNSGYEFTAIFEVTPDFGAIDASGLTIVRHTSVVTDADIDQMIENLRVQRRTWSPVKRPATTGDRVSCEIWSTANGQRYPAEGTEKLTSVIGSGQLLQPIEKALDATEAGQELVQEVDFPSDSPNKDLAGQKVSAHIAVTLVEEPVYPDVDSAFIKSFGVQSTELADFREEIRANLQRELKGALARRLRNEVTKALYAAYEHTELPPNLVTNEARLLAKQQQKNQDTSKQASEATAPDHQPYMQQAAKNVLIGLLLSEFIRVQDIRLDHDLLLQNLRLIASTYEEPQQIIDMYSQNQELMDGLRQRVMEEQVIEAIANQAQSSEVELTFKDALQPIA